MGEGQIIVLPEEPGKSSKRSQKHLYSWILDILAGFRALSYWELLSRSRRGE